MIIHIFLLTHRQLGCGLLVFYDMPNVSVFLFLMADLELYFPANGYSVITCQSSNDDLFLIDIVLSFMLRYSIPNVTCSHCHFLDLPLSFLCLFTPLPHFCWLHCCYFLRPFAHSVSFSFSLFSQYHRDLEMSLSLSASQLQAVMLALNKPVCVL